MLASNKVPTARHDPQHRSFNVAASQPAGLLDLLLGAARVAALVF